MYHQGCGPRCNVAEQVIGACLCQTLAPVLILGLAVFGSGLRVKLVAWSATG